MNSYLYINSVPQPSTNKKLKSTKATPASNKRNTAAQPRGERSTMKSSIKQRLIHEEKETEDVDHNDVDHLVIQQISTSGKENSLPSHLRHNTNLPGFKQQQQQSSRIPVPTQHQPPQPSTATKSKNSTFTGTTDHKKATSVMSSKTTKTPSVKSTKSTTSNSLNTPSKKLQRSDAVLAATPRAQQLLIDQVLFT